MTRLDDARQGDRTAYSPGVELIRRPYGHPDVVALTDQVQAHYRALYGGPGDESIVEVADFEAPTGHFVVGYLDGDPVAMGGWRRLGERPGLPSPNAAEIKRMYVAPSARGRGLSRIVLAELETTARAAGLDWLVLETGRPQTSALGALPLIRLHRGRRHPVRPLPRRARRGPPRQNRSAERSDRSSPQVPARRPSTSKALMRDRLPA